MLPRMPRATPLFGLWIAVLASGCREHSHSLVDLMEENSGVVPANVGGIRGVAAPLSSEIAVDVELPRDPVLSFSVSVRPSDRLDPVPRGVVHLSVHVVESVTGEDFPVYREDLRPRTAPEWRDGTANLAAFRGERVRLRFVAEPGAGAIGRLADELRVVWREPSISEAPPARNARVRPSVLVILVDTLRRDYLGFHGFRGGISPNLDWLARESVELDNAFTQAPWTKPSVASLFTSLYPDVHGLNNHEGLFGKRATEALTTGILPSEAVTMAEAFRDAGYRTAAFVANPWLDPIYGFDQGFELYRMEETTGELLADARRFVGDEDAGEPPFFLYLHFMDVHGPYDAPESDFDAMRSSPSLDVVARPPVAGLERLPPYLENIPWFTDADLAGRGWGELIDFRLERSRTIRARYAANVRDFDRRVAPFLNELRSSKWNDRTIVVLTADHGEELLEHGGWDHGFTLYDDQIRVPMLVRLPRAEGAGRHVTAAANLIDLMPTLLSAARADVPPAAEGRNLWPLIQGEEREDAPFVTLSTATKHREGVYAVRTDRYKLIFDTATGSASLFDLAADPGEYRDRSATDEPDLHRLERLLSKHLADARAKALRPENAPVPDALRKRLESLGYLER